MCVCVCVSPPLYRVLVVYGWMCTCVREAKVSLRALVRSATNGEVDNSRSPVSRDLSLLLWPLVYPGFRDDRVVPLREKGLDREGLDPKPRPRFSVFRPQVDPAQSGHSHHGHRALAAVQPFFQGIFFVCALLLFVLVYSDRVIRTVRAVATTLLTKKITVTVVIVVHNGP